MGVRWVVFDYGEVISRRTGALPSMAAALGVPADQFAEAYWLERRNYDRGCDDLEYWRAVGGRLGVDVDGELSRELTKADTNGWLDTAPGTLRLIDDLREHGVRLALLSNAPSSFGRAAEGQPWARNFEHLIFSGDLKLAKPDPQIWQALLTTIEAQPAECLFFDDRPENVDAARGAGMQAELWRDANEAREALRRYGAIT